MAKRIIRVFPRRTSATPDDDLARVGLPELWDEADEVHLSITFTWDRGLAHDLVKEWSAVAPVTVGGPVTGQPAGDFVPGKYLKEGYVITSRGCPNRCSFCEVWRREGKLRELPITKGWIIQDDNLLACSQDHTMRVFSMLENQPHRPIFAGGLEAARLKPWHVQRLGWLKPKRIYFAYDNPDEYEPLRQAAKLCKEGGLDRGHCLSCYVLVGYRSDDFNKAEKRLQQVLELGMMPFAMLYRDQFGGYYEEWKPFQREWANPTIVGAKLKAYHEESTGH